MFGGVHRLNNVTMCRAPVGCYVIRSSSQIQRRCAHIWIFSYLRVCKHLTCIYIQMHKLSCWFLSMLCTCNTRVIIRVHVHSFILIWRSLSKEVDSNWYTENEVFATAWAGGSYIGFSIEVFLARFSVHRRLSVLQFTCWWLMTLLSRSYYNGDRCLYACMYVNICTYACVQLY